MERLISRQLDGELSEEESLVLARETVRNPEVRRTIETNQRIDALAAGALSSVLGNGETQIDLGALPEQIGPRSRRRFQAAWWFVPGAVAAALLAVVMSGPAHTSGTDGLAEHPGTFRDPTPMSTEGPMDDSAQRPKTMTVSHGPQERIKRDLDREVFGIIGEDGNIYWIEMDRTRTIKGRKADAVRPASGEM